MIPRPIRLLPVIIACALPQARAVDITLDYSLDSNGFFAANPEAIPIMEAVAGYYSSILTDTLNPIASTSPNVGPDFQSSTEVGWDFQPNVVHPGTGQVGFGLRTTGNQVSIAQDEVRIYTGGRVLNGPLGKGGPGGTGSFQLTGSFDGITFFTTEQALAAQNNMFSRGEGGGTQADTDGPTATEFAPWGGSVSFATDANWYFDLTPDDFADDFNAIPAGMNDFTSVAFHEVGHALGLGTADSWYNLVDGNNRFLGPEAMAALGSIPPTYPDDGDAHWAEDTMSTNILGQAQEAMMDPNLLVGSRKLPTLLDLAALSDIGWSVAAQQFEEDPVAVPAVPAPLLGILALFTLLAGARARPALSRRRP
ncbi:MAG: matrixin family metalloprotease [Gammaproteobacteria bacterium]|nr:matrixin family metalloprotease [Gammaproteobacteria bacterium]NNL99396.1 matrixin family metalloprotease [Gammaproteobacteria bacterium]